MSHCASPRPPGLRSPTDCPVGLAIDPCSEHEDEEQDDDDQRSVPRPMYMASALPRGCQALVAGRHVLLTSASSASFLGSFSPFLARRCAVDDLAAPFGFCAVASAITSLKSSSAVSIARPAVDHVRLAVPRLERVVALAAVQHVALDVVAAVHVPARERPQRVVAVLAPRLVLPATRVDRVVPRPAVLLVVAGARRPSGRCRPRPSRCRRRPRPTPGRPRGRRAAGRRPRPPQIRSLPSLPLTMSGPAPAPTRSSPASASIMSACPDPRIPSFPGVPSICCACAVPVRPMAIATASGSMDAPCDYIGHCPTSGLKSVDASVKPARTAKLRSATDPAARARR